LQRAFSFGRGMSAWLGVDGGGTKVSVCALDEAGTVLATAVGASTNQNRSGAGAAAAVD
jgi:N-acetylglucosamine kinase-like BadF-type ATPase